MLRYWPPYDWASVLGYFRAHQIPYLESVDDEGFERVVPTGRGLGWFRVTHAPRSLCLRLVVWNATAEDIVEIEARVRKMFDVEVMPEDLDAAMKTDRYLSRLWAQHPGLRVARSWNGFEALVTTILGQLVSVSFGRVLTGELMRAAGTVMRHPNTSEDIFLFPTAQQLLHADLSSVRTSIARRTTIQTVATIVADGALDSKGAPSIAALRKTLHFVPGVGKWTIEYAAMRGFDDDDAFPASDYGLKQELKRHPGIQIDSVRPWRAYAAVALWASFAKERNRSRESVV